MNSKQKQSIDDLNLLIDNHADAMAISDLKGTILAINDKLAFILGKNKEELAGTSGFDYIESKVGERRGKLIKKVINSKKPVVDFDTERGRWWKTTYQPIVDNKGTVVKLAYYIQEVTYERESEQNLQKKELELADISKKFQIITEYMTDFVFQITLIGKFTYVNPGSERYGYKPEEMIGKNFTKFVPKKELPRYFTQIKKMISGEKIDCFESTVIHKDGHLIPTEFSGQMVKIGKKRFINGIMRNISERKKTEMILKENKEKFRMLSDQSLMGLGIIQGGEIKYTNDAITQITGYSKDNLFSEGTKILSKILHPDDLSFVQEQLQKKLAGDEDVKDRYTCRIITKTGELKWVEIFSKTVKYEGKNADFVTFVDITDTKKSEKEIKKTRNYLQNVIDSTTEIIFTIDQDLKIKTWNETAEKITGYKKRQVVGKPIKQVDLFDYPSEIVDYIKCIQNNKSATLIEISINDIYGLNRIFSISPSFIKDESDNITDFLFVCRDITHEKEIHDRLKDGNCYLIKDTKNDTVLEIFNDLIELKHQGLFVGRKTNEQLRNIFIKNIPQIIKLTDLKDEKYQTSSNPEEMYQKINDFLIKNENTVVLIDRLDYLITNNSFESVMKTLYKINDLIAKNNSILLLHINPSFLNQTQMSIFEEEIQRIPSQQIADIKLDEELFEILNFIDEEGKRNVYVNYGKISKRFAISKITTKKRLEVLINKGLILSKKQGKAKKLILTNKGKNIIVRRTAF